jgi:hypothetical protein
MALHSRRLHDANLSAWWLFLSLIPGIGILAVYALAIIPTTKGTSKYEFEGGTGIGAASLQQQQFAAATPGPDVW